MEAKEIKMKYVETSNHQLMGVLEKIYRTNFPSHGVASRVRQIYKDFKTAQTKISGEFIELLKKFSELDEKGELKRPENDPHGFILLEGKEEEFQKAQEDFGMTEFTLTTQRPLTGNMLQSVNLSAADMDALGPLYEESPEGPGIPNLAGAIPMGKKQKRQPELSQ